MRRWSLILGLLAAAALLPLALVAVPGDGPTSLVRVLAWGFTLLVLALVAWRPLRRWAALPAEERTASLRATAVALPISVGLAFVLSSIAVAVAILVELHDPTLAGRALLADPFDPGSTSYLVVFSLPLLWALRRPTSTAVAAWCARRGIPITDAAVSLARDDLFRVRVWRTVGAVTGVALGYGPGLAYNRLVALLDPADPAREAMMGAAGSGFTLFDPLTLAVVGYVTGAMVAEHGRRSAAPAARPAAALDVRRVGTYTAPLARWLPGGAAALLVVVAGIRAALGEGADPSATDAASVAQAAGAAVVLAGVAALLRRWIVRRPQRSADASQLVVDDAFRASAVHATSGAIAAVTVAYTLLGLQSLADASGLSQTVGAAVGAVFGIAGIVLVIGLWLGYGSSYAWQVSRPATERETIGT